MPDNFGLRISRLSEELAALKRQHKEEKRIAKIANTWISVKHCMPTPEALRAIVWADGQMERCWYSDGNWYVYDGTFFLTDKERLGNVTHWQPRDWMYTKDWPLYGPGIKNWLRYHWQRLTQGASNMAYDLRPGGWGSKAQLDQKVVYYKNERTGEIRMGAPENFPVSKGFNKIVCNTTHEAEAWSDRLRQYNLAKESKIDERRAQIEGEAAKEIRSEIHNRIANSRSKYGRVFMERALERMDKAEARRKMTREEYLHSEGHEHGR